MTGRGATPQSPQGPMTVVSCTSPLHTPALRTGQSRPESCASAPGRQHLAAFIARVSRARVRWPPAQTRISGGAVPGSAYRMCRSSWKDQPGRPPLRQDRRAEPWIDNRRTGAPRIDCRDAPAPRRLTDGGAVSGDSDLLRTRSTHSVRRLAGERREREVLPPQAGAMNLRTPAPAHSDRSSVFAGIIIERGRS